MAKRGPKSKKQLEEEARQNAPKVKPTTKIAFELELEDRMVEFYSDPLGFVRYVYPWGEEGSVLQDFDGPDQWQIDVLSTLGNHINAGFEGAVQSALQLAVASGHGIGKAEVVDNIIDTPDGKRRWGDLKIGDRVFGSNGKPTKVIATHPQGFKTTYKVTFDDESFAITCGEHLWRVNERRKGWHTASTETLMSEGVKRNNGAGRARRFNIPVQGVVEYEYKWTPVDPYTLGAWLGDGGTKTSRITNMDHEVFDKIREAGYILTENYSKANGKAKVFNVSLLNTDLRKLDLGACNSRAKFIPDIYKYNIPEVRAEVLRGLIDTDGYVTKWGTVQYTSVSKDLIDGVIWLVRSLGGKARLYNLKKNDAYTCSICLPDGFIPCYIQRKRDRIRPTTQKRYLERYIDRIEVDAIKECMCITVEAEDHLYLTNDFICTHNSALAAWIIHWFLSTRPHPQIVVTANTQPQLATKTWREVSKWHKMSIHSHWFKWTATRFYKASDPETWFAAAIAWSEANSEAFAGTHEKHVLMLFDEASSIPDVIWEAASGAMTTPGAFWVCFGNPTRNTGRFRECFYRFKHRWTTMQIDARTAKMADKNLLNGWIDDYGLDSDFVRVRCLGIFPKAASTQFISTETVLKAIDNQLPKDAYQFAPVIIGGDPARFGDDCSVIVIRQGLRLLEIREYKEVDTMQFASLIIAAEMEYKADAVFVDVVGIGAGVVDRMRQIGRDVIEVNGANRSTDPMYFNKRAEMWGNMRDWLSGADIINDVTLKDQLISIEYGYSSRGDKIQLEKKEDMKKRGLPSPDRADALSVTFAEPIMHTGNSREEYEDYDFDNDYDDVGRSTVTGY